MRVQYRETATMYDADVRANTLGPDRTAAMPSKAISESDRLAGRIPKPKIRSKPHRIGVELDPDHATACLCGQRRIDRDPVGFRPTITRLELDVPRDPVALDQDIVASSIDLCAEQLDPPKPCAQRHRSNSPRNK